MFRRGCGQKELETSMTLIGGNQKTVLEPHTRLYVWYLTLPCRTPPPLFCPNAASCRVRPAPPPAARGAGPRMEGLSEEEQLAAARMARIAQRAELKAAARRRLQDLGGSSAAAPAAPAEDPAALDVSILPRPRFVSRAEREAAARRRSEEASAARQAPAPAAVQAPAPAASRRPPPSAPSSLQRVAAPPRAPAAPVAIGPRGRERKRRKLTPASDWDASEDTSALAADGLGAPLEALPLRGRGVRAARHGAEGGRAAALRTMLSSGGPAAVKQHWSAKALSDMTERDWRILREDFDIRGGGRGNALPLRSWGESKLPAPLLRAIEALGFQTPSPIQRQAVPTGLLMRDVMGVAETGSGKTVAFALPLLSFVLRQPAARRQSCGEDGPLALVLAPVRELAQQIAEEMQRLCARCDIQIAVVFGGGSIDAQAAQLRAGAQVCVATPGRLADILSARLCVLNQCGYVVLDEADRMVDMGFEPQVREILDASPVALKSADEASCRRVEAQMAGGARAEEAPFLRTTAMFSATMPEGVRQLAASYLRCHAVVQVGDEESSKNKRIEQRLAFVPEAKKLRALAGELRALPRDHRTIVFVNTQRNCDVVARQLQESGFRLAVLHGGRSQPAREEALQRFRTDGVRILVATDVAGRGLDMLVTHVINHDMPQKIESYTHRIGRTGRAGRSGHALTFVTEDDRGVAADLRAHLLSTGAPVPPQLERMLGNRDVGRAGAAPIQD